MCSVCCHMDYTKIISLIICLGSYFHWVLLIKYPDNWHFKIFFLVFYLVFCFLQEGQVGTLLNCLYVNLKLQLTFEQQGFELGRSTYMEIIFNSNCYSIEWSKVLWICGCKTAGMEELTVSRMSTFHCGSCWSLKSKVLTWGFEMKAKSISSQHAMHEGDLTISSALLEWCHSGSISSVSGSQCVKAGWCRIFVLRTRIS